MLETAPEIDYATRACPDSWADYASEIRGAMDVLWEQQDQGLIVSMRHDCRQNQSAVKKPTVSRTWLLLAAFAIENLIKGNVIAQHPEYISNGKLSGKVSKHALSDLAASIDGVTLDGREKELLHLLEELLPSWGRYPVPKRASELADEGVLTPDTHSVFERLFDRLDRHLYERIKLGWQGPHNTKMTELYRTDMEGMVPNDLPLDPAAIRKWKAEQAVAHGRATARR